MKPLPDKAYLLLLNQLFHDTPSKAFKCLEICSTHEQFISEKPKIFSQLQLNEKNIERINLICSTFSEEKTTKELAQNNIHIITIHDENYPQLLKEISDPPIVLYAKGNISCISHPKLAVVGPREATPYGIEVTEYLTQELSNYFCIVSGLAKGIDAAAHKTTIQNNGKTIAILGCGLNIIYPNENKSLAQQIIEKNGLILSEFPIGTEPAAYRFPIRNRIVSGISLGVLVCEASEKSGSLITANTALDQNRDVFAVPGSIYSETSKGTHKLIQSGAKLTTEPNDVLEEYQQTLGIPKKLTKKIPTASKELPQNLSEKEILILQSLTALPVGIDALLQLTKQPIHELLQTLTMLEIKGHIAQEPGKRYKRTL